MTIAEQLLAQGEARGEAKAFTLVAKNLIQDGCDRAEIKRITQLSDKEIEEIVEGMCLV